MNEHVDATLSESLSRSTSSAEKVDALFAFMRHRGGSFYDESVTQLEHALQTAHLARSSQVSPERVTAALLHDIGHFLMDEHDERSDFLSNDWCHEDIGAKSLQSHFAEAVTEPIRLHVPAKRYLCTVDADYFHGLSRASQRSFQLQGGRMSAVEIAEFEGNPFHAAAVLLRRWDDGAKVKGMDVPDLQAYRQDVESCLQRD
jgi:phosphonate degradation associated HDIG domain protein